MYKNNLLVGFNYWYQKVYDFVSLWEPFTHINNSCKRCLLVYNPTNYSDYSKKKNPIKQGLLPFETSDFRSWSKEFNCLDSWYPKIRFKFESICHWRLIKSQQNHSRSRALLIRGLDGCGYFNLLTKKSSVKRFSNIFKFWN